MTTTLKINIVIQLPDGTPTPHDAIMDAARAGQRAAAHVLSHHLGIEERILCPVEVVAPGTYTEEECHERNT